MSQWFRVFGKSTRPPEPAALLQYFRQHDPDATGKFHADADGWFRAEFDPGRGPPALRVERYLANETGIRDELNAWAAWVEAVDDDANHGALMQHIISTAQLFAIEDSADQDTKTRTQELCVGLCRLLAVTTDGVCQADDLGFFAADGTLIVAES
jgi:hypothetical protein